MKQKSTSMIAVLSVVFLGLLTGVTGQVLGQSGRVVSKFGQAQVEGRDVIVHVTVVVPPGANANQVALDAIRNQGARPFQGDEFSTSGLFWDQFSDSNATNDFVVQNYNSANDPTGGGLNALWNTHVTWTEVPTSKFTFSDGFPTDRCPSLVKECKGPQTFDGYNDVAWLAIRGCCTLAVTWFSTSMDEADMALNTNFSWSTGDNDFDVETVMLHENGHVLGLGHSEVPTAVMFATYSEPRIVLETDDLVGVSFLYPLNGATGSISGTVTIKDTSTLIPGATVKLDGTALFGITDGSGTYTIGQIPETEVTDSYSLTASAPGFVDLQVTGVTVTAPNPTGVDFALVVDESPAESLVISNVASNPSGKGGTFKITWNTNKPADSKVTFECCGLFTNSEPVTSHSMSFRGKKGDTYTYWVSSTDAGGNTATSSPREHIN